ncbi:class I adenylate-forming enzyme family protein [Alteraurantiacibacter aquimixticola]|nr:AMP-binding protein [Alteraurantiacibacter aquimixticola]
MKLLSPLYRHPQDRPAVRVADDVFDYGRLTRDIDAMARWLRLHGLEQGDHVGLNHYRKHVTTYWEWIMQLGCLRAGLASSIELGARAAQDRKAVLGWEGDFANADPGEQQLVFAPQGSAPLDEQLDIPDAVLPDDLEERAQRIFQTSGSTGLPKLVRLGRDVLHYRVEQVWRSGYFGADVCMHAAFRLLVTAGFRYPLAAWQAGGVVVLRALAREAASPGPSIAAASFIATSPFLMNQLAQALPGTLPGRERRTIQLVGGRTPIDLRNRLLGQIAGRVLVGYGTTETGLIAQGRSAVLARHPGATGFLVDGVEFEVVDAAGLPLPIGEEGDVRVRSPGMIETELRSADAAEGPGWRDGWFYPGDRAILFEDGMVAVTGRSAETANLGGLTIHLPQIEEAVASVPGVAGVGAVTINSAAEDILVVGVEAKASLDETELRASLARFFPAEQRVWFVQLPQIPRSSMGKVTRGALRDMLKRELEAFRKAGQTA